MNRRRVSQVALALFVVAFALTFAPALVAQEHAAGADAAPAAASGLAKLGGAIGAGGVLLGDERGGEGERERDDEQRESDLRDATTVHGDSPLLVGTKISSDAPWLRRARGPLRGGC